MNYTEMLFNRDERLVNLLNQADSKNLELIEEINNREDEIERLNKELEEYKKDFKEANDLALKLITNNQEYVYKSIKDTIDILIEKLQQKENIIKEVRELLKNDYFEDGSFTNYKKVFELLDKENI